jgi:urease accessory protein
MITISSVVGNVFRDAQLRERFQKTRKTESCELVKISRSELEKTRLRRQTDKGTDVGVVLELPKKLHNGDVLLSNQDKFIVIEQLPEKVISVKTKPNENSQKVLVTLGHIIGNRHRPIQINNDGKIIFPILAENEFEVFKKLFSSINNQIEMKVEELVFEPKNVMNVHEH